MYVDVFFNSRSCQHTTDLFNSTAAPMIQSFLDGYNVTVSPLPFPIQPGEEGVLLQALRKNIVIEFHAGARKAACQDQFEV